MDLNLHKIDENDQDNHNNKNESDSDSSSSSLSPHQIQKINSNHTNNIVQMTL